MTTNISSSYIYERIPDFYGDQQSDYLKESETTIENGLKTLKESLESRNNITEIFYKLLEDFQLIRHMIAKKHNTHDAKYFGAYKLKKENYHYVVYTPLCGQYIEYNSIFKENIENFLNQLKKNNTTSILNEEKTLDRCFKFELSILKDNEIPNFSQTTQLQNKIKSEIDTRDDIDVVMTSYDHMQKLRNKNKSLYQSVILYGIIINKIDEQFPAANKRDIILSGIKPHPNNNRNMWALGTLRMEVGGKLYAMSRYLAWMHDFSIEKMLEHTKVYILHQDPFLIPDTLQEISNIFAKAVCWKADADSIEELKNRVALFRFAFSHCSPSIRGDGTIGDWFELMLYRYHGFNKTWYSNDKLPCFESLVSISFKSYLARYNTVIHVEK